MTMFDLSGRVEKVDTYGDEHEVPDGRFAIGCHDDDSLNTAVGLPESRVDDLDSGLFITTPR